MNNRARRMADRQGLTVRARRIKDPRALNFGGVELIDEAPERLIQAAGHSWSSIEAYLLRPRRKR